VVVGHNVRFDLRFMNAALDSGMYEPIGAHSVDTVPLARRLLGEDVADCRLSTLAAALGLEHQPTHRALDDARATVELLHLLIERATGYGVLTLDDLIELPRVARHRYAAKLPLTNHLPREPGVFVFHGNRDEVLHVGRATDIRRQVRRYFASADRRRIAPLLREARRVAAIPLDDPLAAEIVELRLVQRHRPRYDRAAVRAASAACYVHVDPRCRRRPSIVREPRVSGLHIGPLPTRVMAELTVHALHALGDAGAVVAVTGAPGAGLDDLRENATDRVRGLDTASATRLRAASGALAGALARQRLLDGARGHGCAILSSAARTLAIDHGLVRGIGAPGAAPEPLAVPAAGCPDWAGTDRPLPRWAAAEVLRVGRRLRVAET
jgi:hypothetical protein